MNGEHSGYPVGATWEAWDGDTVYQVWLERREDLGWQMCRDGRLRHLYQEIWKALVQKVYPDGSVYTYLDDQLYNKRDASKAVRDWLNNSRLRLKRVNTEEE